LTKSTPLYPSSDAERPLFESIMPVALTVSCVLLAGLCFGRSGTGSAREGAFLGVLWLVMSIGIVLLMFSWGPMRMGIAQYVMDTGLTYLIYPAITVGFGYLVERTREARAG
jgi:hypothetical protein